MKEIDARGLACPAPVLQTKAALREDKPNRVKVVVDNAAAQQNVQRFLESQGFQSTLKQYCWASPPPVDQPTKSGHLEIC